MVLKPLTMVTKKNQKDLEEKPKQSKIQQLWFSTFLCDKLFILYYK